MIVEALAEVGGACVIALCVIVGAVVWGALVDLVTRRIK